MVLDLYKWAPISWLSLHSVSASHSHTHVHFYIARSTPDPRWARHSTTLLAIGGLLKDTASCQSGRDRPDFFTQLHCRASLQKKKKVAAAIRVRYFSVAGIEKVRRRGFFFAFLSRKSRFGISCTVSFFEISLYQQKLVQYTKANESKRKLNWRSAASTTALP